MKRRPLATDSNVSKKQAVFEFCAQFDGRRVHSVFSRPAAPSSITTSFCKRTAAFRDL